MSQPEQTTLLHEIFTALPGILPIFIDLLGVSVVLPLLPVYVNSLGESATWVGAVLAGQFIGQAIGTPLMGAFADRYGPKKALLAAMIGNGVFFIISAFEMPMIALVFVRLFGALSNATGGGQKWIIDASSPKHRDVMLTLPMAAVLLGFLVGAAIGGVTGSWSLSCYITAGLSILAGIVLLPFKEPKDAAARAQTRAEESLKAAAGNKTATVSDGFRSLGFWLASAAVFGGGLVMGAMTTLAGIVLVNVYEEGALTGSIMYYIAIAFTAIVMLTLYPLLQRVPNREFVMTFGLFIGGGALALCAYLQTLSSYWPFLLCSVPLGFASLALTMVQADAVLAAHVEVISPELAGTMMGLEKMFSFGAMGISPVLSAALFEFDPTAAWLTMAGLTFAVAIITSSIALVKGSSLAKARLLPNASAPSDSAPPALKAV